MDGKCNFDYNFPRATVRRSHLSMYVDSGQEEGGCRVYVVVVLSVLHVKNTYGIGQKFMKREGRKKKVNRPIMGGGDVGKLVASRD